MRPLVVVSLLFSVMSGAAHAASTDNLCAGLYSGKAKVGVPQVGKPPFRKYYREPAFGTKVMRITKAREGEVFKPAYSSMQAWNSDETKILLYRGGSDPGHVLLDGTTYEHVRDLNIQPSDLEEVYWSHTDPDVFFYMSQHYIPTGGGDVQMQSWDDDLFGFRCRLSADKYMMFTYRLSTDEIIKAPIGEKTTQWQEWSAPIPGPSGKQLWYQGKVIDTDLQKDAVFQTVFNDSPGGCDGDKGKGVGHLVVHNIETGECRPVINEERGYPYTTRGTHVSVGEPHATISPSGTRIIFGSDWYDSGSVDTYVIELPGYQKPL